jgi:hypothetical protein
MQCNAGRIPSTQHVAMPLSTAPSPAPPAPPPPPPNPRTPPAAHPSPAPIPLTIPAAAADGGGGGEVAACCCLPGVRTQSPWAPPPPRWHAERKLNVGEGIIRQRTGEEYGGFSYTFPTPTRTSGHCCTTHAPAARCPASRHGSAQGRHTLPPPPPSHTGPAVAGAAAFGCSPWLRLPLRLPLPLPLLPLPWLVYIDRCMGWGMKRRRMDG